MKEVLIYICTNCNTVLIPCERCGCILHPADIHRAGTLAPLCERCARTMRLTPPQAVRRINA